MSKEITEQDLRLPEFRNVAKVELSDYERRDDGKIVRKDRWETGIRKIAGILGINEFEIEDVIAELERRLNINDQIHKSLENIEEAQGATWSMLSEIKKASN